MSSISVTNIAKKRKLLIKTQFFISMLTSCFNIRFWINYGRLKKMKGRYTGERCFIMGNGPSLNKTPLNMLSKEFVWGLNRCYLLYDRITWRPTFYTAVDDLVVPDIADEIHEMISYSPDTYFFFPDTFHKQKIINSAENILWFKHVNRNPALGPRGYFSSNAALYLRIPNSVTITAIQLASYLGFNPIILIGCDTVYQIPSGVKSEGEAMDIGTGERILNYNILSNFDNDPNHFTPVYFGAGRKWHNPNVNGMINGYKNAKMICEHNNIRIIDATIGGYLDVFQKIDFRDLF